MKSTYTILCLLGFLSIVCGTRIGECSQGGVVPEEVHVEGCESDTTIFCSVHFNGYMNVTMRFTAPHYFASIQPKLVGKTAFGTFNITLADQPDACTGITNSVCPIVMGEMIELKYSARLLVVPIIPLELEFGIIDTDLGTPVVCFSLDIFPVKW